MRACVCVCTLYINIYPVLMVPTNACFHVHWSHEAIITQTAILSRNVGTLPTITDIRIIFTFINIWWYKIKIKWKTRMTFIKLMHFFPSSSTQNMWSQICKIRLTRCTKSVYFPSYTCTRPPIWHQGITFTAATFIASFCISALGVTASVHYHTFVNICKNIATTLLVRDTALKKKERVFLLLLKQTMLQWLWIFHVDWSL